MVVHISLSEDDVGETVCSLNFAKRARSIESNREIPEVSIQTEPAIATTMAKVSLYLMVLLSDVGSENVEAEANHRA
jgi:hypothetical protein